LARLTFTPNLQAPVFVVSPLAGVPANRCLRRGKLATPQFLPGSRGKFGGDSSYLDSAVRAKAKGMSTTTAQITTDKQLIERSRAGNSDAFGELVRKYQNRLFTSLCQVAGSRADAEDIAQEAFIQAYLKLATFRQHCAFYTWLYRIALNLWYTRARSQRVRACLSQARPVHDDDRSDPYGTPVDELQRREQAQQIRQALNGLSEEHRTILVLRGVDGFDYDRIAEILELNAGTVRSRLHRARLEFRDQLAQRSNCHA
jgi:RNA polymerase sigma-70 factor (ECF subfamily)